MSKIPASLYDISTISNENQNTNDILLNYIGGHKSVNPLITKLTFSLTR